MWGLTRYPGCLALEAAKAYRSIYLMCPEATHPSAQLSFTELTYPPYRLSLRIAGNFGQSCALHWRKIIVLKNKRFIIH